MSVRDNCGNTVFFHIASKMEARRRREELCLIFSVRSDCTWLLDCHLEVYAPAPKYHAFSGCSAAAFYHMFS